MNYYYKIYFLLSESFLFEKSLEQRRADFEILKKYGLLQKRTGDFGDTKLHIPAIRGMPGTGDGGRSSTTIDVGTNKKEVVLGKHSSSPLGIGSRRGKPKGESTPSRGSETRSQRSASDKLRTTFIQKGKLNPYYPDWAQRQKKKDPDWTDTDNLRKI